MSTDKVKILNTLYSLTIRDFGSKTYNKLSTKKADFEFVFDDLINEYIDEVTAEQIVKIDETTVNQVQNRIKLGQSEGMTIREIAKTIDDLYLEQIIPNRSTTIARTETISSSNYGSLAGAEQATEDFDIKIKKIWIRTFDKRVRDTHIHAGQHKAIKLKEKFRVGRSLLRFPGDFAGGSKETIRCRCALGYESDD